MNLHSPISSRCNLGALLNAGESVLICDEAANVLNALPQGLARLVLIDPPYNRRTKFHHYDDSKSKCQWISDIEMNCIKLRDILRDDGSLWMHIDDSEMPTCRLMLDRVFGPENFVATIIWRKTLSRDNRKAISTSHEYVLVYAKAKSLWLKYRHKLIATTEQLGRYKNPDNDPRGPWTSGDLTAKAGPGRRAAQFYPVITPSGREVIPATGTCWRFTKERLQEMIQDNRIDFGTGSKMPRLKRFLSEVEPGLVPDTWWEGDEVGTADSAKRHLKSLFPKLVPFETPKPEELTSKILSIASDPGDLVVDVYGGSCTTAAVSQKMRRQWLVCEREIRTFHDFAVPRLHLVTAGKDRGGISEKVGWTGGGGYKTLSADDLCHPLYHSEIMANSHPFQVPKQDAHRVGKPQLLSANLR